MSAMRWDWLSMTYGTRMIFRSAPSAAQGGLDLILRDLMRLYLPLRETEDRSNTGGPDKVIVVTSFEVATFVVVRLIREEPQQQRLQVMP